MIEEIMTSANIICAIGTGLQVYSVIKNKKILKGYSLSGSLLTFLAVLLFQIGFFLMDYKLSWILGIITVLYWFSVIVYKLRYR